MKKIYVAAVFLLGSNICFAQQITLVCKGWAPYYKNFADWPLNERTNDDNFVINLDLKKRESKYNTQIGEIISELNVDERFYSGKKSLSIEAGGKIVTGVNLSIDRLTGSAYLSYDFHGEKNGKVLFSGDCAPGKPLF